MMRGIVDERNGRKFIDFGGVEHTVTMDSEKYEEIGRFEKKL